MSEQCWCGHVKQSHWLVGSCKNPGCGCQEYGPKDATPNEGAAPRAPWGEAEKQAMRDLSDAWESELAAPRAEGPPDDRTCLTHPRQVAHDWHHQSYEGTWLCHCTVCGIVPNRAAPRITWPMAGPAPTGTMIPGLDDERAAPSDDYTKGWNDALDGIVAAEGAAPRACVCPMCVHHTTAREVSHE